MYKVLVVDDDPNVNLFISRLLMKKFHCEVVTAVNGLDGLSKLKEENPEVVFLDVTMPVMNGIETLQAIRGDKNFKNVPIIMLTAVRERDVVGKVMNLGVIDYVLKPLMYDETYVRLKEIFEKIKEMKEEEERERLAEANGEKKEKILIVDTDIEFRENFKRQLENDFKILESDSGAEGLQIFMKEKPKIVCLGENLPLLNERMFAQKIRATRSDSEITIFAIRENTKVTGDDSTLFDCIVNKKDSQSLFSGENN